MLMPGVGYWLSKICFLLDMVYRFKTCHKLSKGSKNSYLNIDKIDVIPEYFVGLQIFKFEYWSITWINNQELLNEYDNNLIYIKWDTTLRKLKI